MKRLVLSVRADAMTTHVVDVPAHELSVLKTLFAGQVTETSTADDAEPMPDVDSEYGRLASKYGGAVIERVFGLPETGGLEKALAVHKAKKPRGAEAGADSGAADAGA